MSFILGSSGSNGWSEATARYPELAKLPAAASPDIQNNLIAQAEGFVHGSLASQFSIPFSNTNVTAKDLVIDALYVQNIQSRQVLKGKTLATVLADKITALKSGLMQMVTIAGTVAQVPTGDPVWSSTMNYPPTFGMGDLSMMAVSSDMLIDENAARGDPTVEAF